MYSFHKNRIDWWGQGFEDKHKYVAEIDEKKKIRCDAQTKHIIIHLDDSNDMAQRLRWTGSSSVYDCFYLFVSFHFHSFRMPIVFIFGYESISICSFSFGFQSSWSASRWGFCCSFFSNRSEIDIRINKQFRLMEFREQHFRKSKTKSLHFLYLNFNDFHIWNKKKEKSMDGKFGKYSIFCSNDSNVRIYMCSIQI